MGMVNRPGTYRGVITQSGIGETQSKLPQFIAKFRALELYDNSEVGNEQWVDWSEFEENEITGYFVLVSKKGEPIGFQIENLKKALGWDGVSFLELGEGDYSNIQVQFRVENNTYEGKMRLQVVHIDHADAIPGGTLRILDTQDLKKLDAKFASKLRKLSGGPKPKAVGKPAKPGKPVDPTKNAKDAATSSTEDQKDAQPSTPSEAPSAAPSTPKSSKPPRGRKKKDKPAGIAERLGLPAEVDEDAAWEQLIEHMSSEFNEDNAGEAWYEAVCAIAGIEDQEKAAEAIDKNKAWAQVRDAVLGKLTDDPSL